MKPVSYQTALITGASSGIGASFARFLASRRMTVLLAARRLDRLETVRAEISAAGGHAEVYGADLSIEEERNTLFKTITGQHQVDILINNAGFGWYGYYHLMNWDVARRMMATNMEAVAHLTSLFLAPMLTARRGYVINIGSIAGIFPNQGVALYSATKSFLNGFTTALHRELRGSGVSASVMNLGPVRTEFFEQARRIEGGRRKSWLCQWKRLTPRYGACCKSQDVRCMFRAGCISPIISTCSLAAWWICWVPRCCAGGNNRRFSSFRMNWGRSPASGQ